MGVNPCGFCGLDSSRPAGCKTQLLYGKAGKAAIKSTCPYFYTGITNKYEAKKIFSTQNPCTNLPMHCPVCKPGIANTRNTVWSYNFMMHLWHAHCTDGSIPGLDPKTWVEAFVSKAEESFMGICDADTDQWREVHEALNSEGIAQLANSLPPSSESGHDESNDIANPAIEASASTNIVVPTKRGRSDTTTTSASAQARIIRQK
jgi:hypothetical protein